MHFSKRCRVPGHASRAFFRVIGRRNRRSFSGPRLRARAIPGKCDAALYPPGVPDIGGPAESRWEVIVGACPTQNIAGTNVERALHNLRSAHPLTIAGIRNLRGGSLDKMLSQPTGKLRAELRACNGVCPEAADSIPLYAGNQPVFVVDARTPRILDRHALLPDDTDCEEILHPFHHAPGSVADREQTNHLFCTA